MIPLVHVPRPSLINHRGHHYSISCDQLRRCRTSCITPEYGGKPRVAPGQTPLGVRPAVANSPAPATPGRQLRLTRLQGFTAGSERATRFASRDRAYDCAILPSRPGHGFSWLSSRTGCGKTLASSRILYALTRSATGAFQHHLSLLADPTSQTGYPRRGSAAGRLFAILVRRQRLEQFNAERLGMSQQELLAENSRRPSPARSRDGLCAEWLGRNSAGNAFLRAPILACHHRPPDACQQACAADTRIAPLLRLMTSNWGGSVGELQYPGDLPPPSRHGALGQPVRQPTCSPPRPCRRRPWLGACSRTYPRGSQGNLYSANRGAPRTALPSADTWFEPDCSGNPAPTAP